MARLDEVAEGISDVLLATESPEPLPVDLRGQSPAEVAFFARAVADACERKAVPLSLVRVDPQLGSALLNAVVVDPLAGGRVKVEAIAELGSRLEFFRFLPG